MKKTTINFSIDLDENNVPENIHWEASDNSSNQPQDTRSVSISLWDHKNKNTLRIDLWTKEMPVDEMKRFTVDCIGGLAQSVLSATGDEYMSQQMNELCDRLVEHVKKEE